ncbi:MAG: DUF58 domain-containing protein [Planctomycetes bacterium]|nr:DUF58 domain-containing protein [Planctomycetota bacterium]
MRPRPTVLGVKGLFFYAAVTLAFLATAYSNLFFLLLAFLAVMGLLGIAWGARNLAGLRVELLGVAPAPAGTDHEVRLRLVGGRRLRFQLQIAIDLPDERALVLDVPLLTGERTVTARLPARPRGVHAVSGVQVLTRYPFGIMQWSVLQPATGEAIAYPPPAAIHGARDRQAALTALLGERQVAGGGDGIAGLRPFRDGDNPRLVHWKASARRGEPVVKEPELDAGEVLEVSLDRRCSTARLDEALGIVSALVLLAADAKEVVQLKSQDHAAAYGPGQRSTGDALRWLAAAAPLPPQASAPPAVAATAVRLPRRACSEAGHG